VEHIDIFISWSGEKSKKVAEALRRWLPCIYQSVLPWLSSSSIQPGSRWGLELARKLEEVDFGILCLTKDNLNAPWILFEAGALSKSVEDGRVVPFLIDLSPEELDGPLSQFQAMTATEDGVRELLRMIAKINPANFQKEETIDWVFRMWWPLIAKSLNAAILA
jgi:hypothetical protein